MRVYHFINTQYGLQVLLERRLKIARVHELNDPFEFIGMDLSEDTLREAMERIKDDYNEIIWHTLCFSKRWDNPVQWAHYADGHRCLCLGFDIPDEHLTKVSLDGPNSLGTNLLSERHGKRWVDQAMWYVPEKVNTTICV